MSSVSAAMKIIVRSVFSFLALCKGYDAMPTLV